MTIVNKQGPILALGIILIALGWMILGGHGITHAQSSSDAPESKDTKNNSAETPAAFHVQTQTSHAQRIQDTLVLSGQTNANQTLVITAQETGKVTSVKATQGDDVKAGAILLTIDDRTLQANIQYAQSLVKQSALELEGIKRLTSQKLTSDVSVAVAEANLASAKANLTDLMVKHENSRVSAPFSGVLNDFSIQPGQWLSSGDSVATLVDLSPLKVTANLPQIHLSSMALGSAVTLDINGQYTATGNVSFISKVANNQTRTLPIEIAIPNRDHIIPAGLTATVRITLSQISAHKISPSLLSIDDNGRMSVKTVSKDHLVQAHAVTVVRSNREHVFVKGLPEEVTLITVGHGFVKVGDTVDVPFAEGETSL